MHSRDIFGNPWQTCGRCSHPTPGSCCSRRHPRFCQLAETEAGAALVARQPPEDRPGRAVPPPTANPRHRALESPPPFVGLPRTPGARRVGIDGLPCQSGVSFRRGIGRYARGLIAALAAAEPATEWFLYARGPSAAGLPTGPNLVHRPISGDLADALDGNPDRLDALILTSPYESHLADRRGFPIVAAVVYDLIHDRLPEPFRYSEAFRDQCENYLSAARGYDRLLAISEATRLDFIELRKFDPAKVVTIGAGVEPIFRPDASPRPAGSPYILHVGGGDHRKGGRELVAAVGLMPAEVRPRYGLVYAYEVPPAQRRDLTARAEAAGVRLEFTGYVDDPVLAALYRSAAVMALPSRAEGFGLPLAEAIACGCPVVFGANTAQPEVAGDAGVGCDAGDPADIARALAEAIEPGRNAELRAACAGRAGAFDWGAVARRTLEALMTPVVHSNGMVAHNGPITTHNGASARRPRVAIVSPWPPYLSGVADYAARLAGALRDHADVTLVREDDTAVVLPGKAAGLPVIDARDFRAGDFDAISYQHGNNAAHRFVHALAMRFPGHLTAHDPRCEHLIGGPGWRAEFDGLCERQRSVLVHARCNLDHLSPKARGRAAVVPFGAEVAVPTAEEQAATRRRFGLPKSAWLVGMAGIAGPAKLSLEAVAAFALAVGKGWLPSDASLVVIGPEADGGLTRAMAAAVECGLKRRVSWLGQLAPDDFAAACAACDAGLVLRRPPTNGETSAALFDFLRAGVPTIVTDTGTFAEMPDAVVAKTSHVEFGGYPAGVLGVAERLRDLHGDPAVHRGYRDAALAWVAGEHAWEKVAAAYLGAMGIKGECPPPAATRAEKPRIRLGVDQKVLRGG